MVEVGPSTASLANQTPVYCGCPAGTHGCDLVSRARLDQSANPVVVWLGLVSRVREVIVEIWNMRKSQHPSSTRSWSRAGRLWDHHYSNLDVHSHLISTLRSCSLTRLLLLDIITGMSTTLLHEVDLWNLLHDLTWTRHRPCH